jgi:hypothetical protein
MQISLVPSNIFKPGGILVIGLAAPEYEQIRNLRLMQGGINGVKIIRSKPVVLRISIEELICKIQME